MRPITLAAAHLLRCSSADRVGAVRLLCRLLDGGLWGDDALAGSKAGRTADLYFTVVGYDSAGDKTTLNFRFVNPKPATRLRQELPMLTGLAMGETRSLADLERHRDPLPQRLGSGPAPQSIPSERFEAPDRYR